jgi:hypothetical protein
MKALPRSAESPDSVVVAGNLPIAEAWPTGPRVSAAFVYPKVNSTRPHYTNHTSCMPDSVNVMSCFLYRLPMVILNTFLLVPKNWYICSGSLLSL